MSITIQVEGEASPVIGMMVVFFALITLL